MSPTDQYVAIAKACGWRDRVENAHYDNEWHQDDTHCGAPPDYLSDLKAMHKAEQTLFSADGRFDRWCEYWEHLETITDCRTFDKDINSDCMAMLHASAAQRAEAFLKAIGKWTQPKPKEEK